MRPDIPPVGLLEALRRAYGSIERPLWNFVAEAEQRQPFTPLISHISRDVGVECVQDMTDTNEDVAFVYAVRSVLGQTMLVYLSMVGPYALLVPQSGGVRSGDERVAPGFAAPVTAAPDGDHLAARVLHAVRHAGFYVMDATDAVAQIDMFDGEQRPATVFSLLFENGGDPPWEGEQRVLRGSA